MSPLTNRARQFYSKYGAEYELWRTRAQLAEDYIKEIVVDLPIDLHIVSARAKDPRALLQKIRRKGYGSPSVQLFDRIGVRVITYYEEDVNRVVDALKIGLTINATHSEDKRTTLALREFGYRSVHLVAKVPEVSMLPGRYSDLKGHWFEVQVRSILEHAWAEIEHHIQYKAGTNLPENIRRRLSAIAGALEVLEHEFTLIRGERDVLVSKYRSGLDQGHDWDRKLDAPLLIATLELLQPEGQGWRTAVGAGDPLPVGSEGSATELLETVGVSTPDSLKEALADPDVRGFLRDVSAARGTAPTLLSHLLLVIAAAAALDRDTVRLDYPELVEWAGLIEIAQ